MLQDKSATSASSGPSHSPCLVFKVHSTHDGSPGYVEGGRVSRIPAASSVPGSLVHLFFVVVVFCLLFFGVGGRGCGCSEVGRMESARKEERLNSYQVV